MMPPCRWGLAIVLVVGCGGGSSSDPSLPVERPADFTIEVSSNGGMVLQSDSIAIGPAGGVVDEDRGELASHSIFAVTDDDLDALWKVCRQQRFDTIRTRKRVLYDAGGWSMEIVANGRTSHTYSSGAQEIVAADWPRFRAIIDAVQALPARAPHTPVTLILDPSLAGEDIYVFRGTQQVFHGPAAADQPVTIPALPGTHGIEVQGRHAVGRTVIEVGVAPVSLRARADGDRIAIE